MIQIKNVHHIAIICSNYQVSKKFYSDILGFTIIRETFRKERNSYKLDLALNGNYCIELFSFANPPKRVSRPEACGMRHLAFEVDNLEESLMFLHKNKVQTEDIRLDQITNKRFVFFNDPDGLPIELYEN